MGSNLANGFAIYPMVEESEATGRTASVYAEILQRMPLVPSLFKSLAVCPPYLSLAWEQARGVIDEAVFAAAARRLAASVRAESQPPGRQDCRAELARFVDPLARMLLLSAGLLEALEGRLGGPPATDAAVVQGNATPAQPAPSQWEADHPVLFGEIRSRLQTPVVNSVWRALAGKGLLEPAWATLGLQVETVWPAAENLRGDALDTATRLPWQTVASREALDRVNTADAAPGAAAILDAYVKTLPRVLALAASSSAPEPA